MFSENELIRIYGKNNKRPNWKTSINIGAIEGGKSINQVCNNAVVKFDFRYPETDSPNNILNTVNDIAKKVGGEFVITTASVGMPTYTDRNLLIVKKFIFAMQKVYKKKIIIQETYGTSDARHFAKYNIPTLMMKPIASEMHSEDEWVSISSSLKFFQGLKIFIANLNAKI